MIEPTGKPFTFVDGEVELELVAAAPGRIGPYRVLHHVTVAAGISLALKRRLHPRDAIQKPCKLGERNRPPVIEAAGRMALAQQLCSGRDRLRLGGGNLPQIDCFSRPTGPHRRQLARGASTLSRSWQSSRRARSSSPGKPACRRNCLSGCGVAKAATVAAILGSQILNNAPARGDSRTSSLARRRRYANRDRTRA